MIELYYWTTPNGHKITIFLEEAGTPYRIVPINISMGQQFGEEFLKIANNPALETFYEFAAFVCNANENLSAILRVAETFDQASLDQALDQARGRWSRVAHQFRQLRHVQS